MDIYIVSSRYAEDNHWTVECAFQSRVQADNYCRERRGMDYNASVAWKVDSAYLTFSNG